MIIATLTPKKDNIDINAIGKKVTEEANVFANIALNSDDSYSMFWSSLSFFSSFSLRFGVIF